MTSFFTIWAGNSSDMQVYTTTSIRRVELEEREGYSRIPSLLKRRFWLRGYEPHKKSSLKVTQKHPSGLASGGLRRSRPSP